jgi:hypothetical protein
VIAVYSAHPAGPLSLLVRSKPFTAKQFGEMERHREAVRTVAMRGSAFLVPVEHAARLFVATRSPPGRLATRLRALGLDLATYNRLKPRILAAAAAPISPRELEASLKADRRAVFAMRAMAREGLILRVGWDDRVRSDSLRWVATAAWLGTPLDRTDPDASRRWLAEAYLRAFGPARVTDFAWWSGIPRRDASAALDAVTTVKVADELLLPADQADAWAAVKPIPPDAVRVLPKWDPYSMGHAPDGRQRLVDDEHLPLAFSTADTRVGATAGDALPLILRGGRAIASWSHRLDGDRMTVTIAPFGRSRLPARAALNRAFAPIGEFFEANVELPTD